jgi:hypothetical protein
VSTSNVPDQIPNEVADLDGLVARARGIRQWLNDTYPACLTDQEHLDAGSKERAYWHYGYMVALNDALGILTGDSPLKGERGTRQ